jgi:predicted nucleic acid-binding protein
VNARDALHGHAQRQWQRLLAGPNFACYHLTRAYRDWRWTGWQLFASRHNKEWGVTDCVSMEVMRRMGIWDVFSDDHDFEQG